MAFEITGKTTQRTEIFEYPIPALRELVLNAIIHRDYTSPVDIQIKIFDQSITLFNPGKLFGGITIEQLKTDSYQSQTRNKLIAEVFYLTKDIEKYGSGFIRIRREIKEYPTMLFEYRELGDGFLVEIKYEKQKTSLQPRNDVGKDVGKEIAFKYRSIIETIRNNPEITIPELAKTSGLTTRTIERKISELKNYGLLQRTGGRKEGYWALTDEQ
ncbi:MAG: winged helix-turn-helix transcriptional regulator [Bacteroidales bacterium]|nr:winged helix-turn-helix transcriptional regulator [Bacteroidales bacterium]